MTSPRRRLTKSESLHHQVARNIRNEIEAGILRDGDVLPSTRELAAQWNVSVFTITEAMKFLAAEGLVVSKSRSNRVVRVSGQTRKAEVRLPTPQVILIGGFAGSGKTELGRILARETGWPILDKDTLTRPIVEAALEMLGQSPHDRESDTYVDLVRPREYEALMAAGTENIECGNSVILTAPFIRELNNASWVNRTRATFVAMNAHTTFVWVHCNADTMHTYIRHRGAARDATKLANWQEYLASIRIDFRPVTPHFLIDNSASSSPLQNQAKQLLETVFDSEST